MQNYEAVYAMFSPFADIRSIIGEDTEEIRVRCGRKTEISANGKALFIDFSPDINTIALMLNRAAQYSLYAMEDEICEGFITLKGGHRVGFCGKTVHKNKKIVSVEAFSSLNIRIAHELPGCSDNIFGFIAENGTIYSSLILSPPAVGKTTLLRDICRRLASLETGYAHKVVLVDERGELAAVYNGIAQLDVGFRTDVYDSCPKTEGIMLALRTMSPDVIITDEIGSAEDIAAIREATGSGVAVIASAHAALSGHGVNARIKAVTREKLFERYIYIKRESNITEAICVFNGEVEQIYGI